MIFLKRFVVLFAIILAGLAILLCSLILAIYLIGSLGIALWFVVIIAGFCAAIGVSEGA